MLRPAFRLLPVVVLCISGPGSLVAQDTHYWVRQYGTASELLSGLVVGSVRDPSATYYNPGALALAEQPGFMLTFESLELTRITIPDKDKDIRQTRLATGPGILAGTLPESWFGRGHRVGYSLLTRQDLDVVLRKRDADPYAPGATPLFADIVQLDAKVTDIWAGATWSYTPGRHFGIGATGYLATRSTRGSQLLIDQFTVPNADSGATALAFQEFSYLDFRALMKIGATLGHDPWRFGITVTTPSLHLAGRGDLGINLSSVGQDLTGDGSADAVLASNFQDKLAPTYKSPLSVAGGASVQLGRTRLHGTAEWFEAISEYTVLQGATFQAQSDGSPITPSIEAEAKSVVNWGVGVEHEFNSDVAAFVSYAIDRSTLPDSTSTRHAFSSWDINHVRGGATFRVAGIKVALGLGLSFGSEQVPLDDPIPGIIPPSPVDVSWRRWKLILGFYTGGRSVLDPGLAEP
jgi:hypothetical protein